MDRQDLINTCVFEQFQGLLFSDLSGPLSYGFSSLSFGMTKFKTALNEPMADYFAFLILISFF